jgi:hypothetical protein
VIFVFLTVIIFLPLIFKQVKTVNITQSIETNEYLTVLSSSIIHFSLRGYDFEGFIVVETPLIITAIFFQLAIISQKYRKSPINSYPESKINSYLQLPILEMILFFTLQMMLIGSIIYSFEDQPIDITIILIISIVGMVYFLTRKSDVAPLEMVFKLAIIPVFLFHLLTQINDDYFFMIGDYFIGGIGDDSIFLSFLIANLIPVSVLTGFQLAMIFSGHHKINFLLSNTLDELDRILLYPET